MGGIGRMKEGEMPGHPRRRAAVAAACLVLAMIPHAEGFSACGAAAASARGFAGCSLLSLQPRGGSIRRGFVGVAMNRDGRHDVDGGAEDAGGAGLGRREALAGLGAVLAALSAPSDVAAELTPFAETTLRNTGAFPGMQGTEINGKKLDGIECQGSRGNRCNVWSPPEVEASPPVEKSGNRGVVTTKVFLDVRVIKDYTGEVLEDSAVRGRIVIGLYGKDSPKTAEQFLKFAKADDASDPSYNSGMFYKHQAGRWIEGGKINGLNLEEFGGGQVYQYLNKIVNLNPILEANKLAHTRKNLITHRKFNAGPEFAITLSPAPELDGDWTVFGEVLEGEEMVKAIADLPFVTGKSLDPSGTIADSWWKAQNNYFKGLAKQFGDSRANKMYPGKLLRRVEIVKCGVLG